MTVINLFKTSLLKTSREEQFSSHIRPHLQNMYRQAYRLSGNQQDAEDLVQDLLIRLYQKEINFKEIEKPASWLLRSLYHQFIDHVRKKNRLPIDNKESDSNDLLDSMHDDTKAPHTVVEKNANHQSLRNAINTLNPDQQALITLHDIEGHSLTELSEILDSPVGTLKSRLHRARKSLREILSLNQNSREPFTSKQRFIS